MLQIEGYMTAVQKSGRDIEPCFSYGDLWEGNTGTEANTLGTDFFDCSRYWAHVEMEIVLWRKTASQNAPREIIGKVSGEKATIRASRGSGRSDFLYGMPNVFGPPLWASCATEVRLRRQNYDDLSARVLEDM